MTTYIAIPEPVLAVIEEAKHYIGEEEKPRSSNRSIRIDYWLTETGVDVGLPWCAAFVSAVGRQALGRAWPVPRSASVQTIVDWAKTSVGILQDTPQAGDLFVLYFPIIKRFAHIGVVTEVLENGNFKTVEGNTNSDGSRDGYGVFMRERKVTSESKFVRWKSKLIIKN